MIEQTTEQAREQLRKKDIIFDAFCRDIMAGDNRCTRTKAMADQLFEKEKGNG